MRRALLAILLALSVLPIAVSSAAIEDIGSTGLTGPVGVTGLTGPLGTTGLSGLTSTGAGTPSGGSGATGPGSASGSVPGSGSVTGSGSGAGTGATVGTAKSPLTATEFRTLKAVARAQWAQVAALCAAPRLVAPFGLPVNACRTAIEQFDNLALLKVTHKYPQYASVVVPKPGAVARATACRLKGQARQSCPAITAALTARARADADAIADQRALLLAVSRWYGAVGKNTFGQALQRDAIAVDLSQLASALGDAGKASSALAAALPTGDQYVITAAQERTLERDAITLKSTFRSAEPVEHQIGFTAADQRRAALAALAPIHPAEHSLASLVGTGFPSLSPIQAALRTFRLTQVYTLLLALSHSQTLPFATSQKLILDLADAQGAASVAGGRADVRKMIRLAQTAGDAGAFFATATTPLATTFIPLGPPSAKIAFPATGGTYALGQAVATSFSCGGTAVRCVDSVGNATGRGALVTGAAGQYTYTVTATDPRGKTGKASITYTVEKGATKMTIIPFKETPNGLIAATLTVAATQAPIPGETVVFTEGKTGLCTATTDLNGNAVCFYPGSDALSISLAGFTASFAGDSNFLPSTATGGSAAG